MDFQQAGMENTSRIREKIDLVSFIAEYIELKKAGRNFKAVCPFHNEKTPSFVVSPERQIWHCFGCGKGGDCFTFLMEYEKAEFPEALRILATKAGIELKETQYERGVSSRKEKIYKLNKLALEYYHYILTEHKAGKAALAYLTEKRKINEKVLKTFMVGFAPSSGVALSEYLIGKKHYKNGEVLDAGLGFLRNGRVFDFFRERIIFPLFDHRDNTVGFSGRELLDSSSGSKYINTRETLAYHKGSHFFGLNAAKEEIKKKEEAIIVEGELDLMSSFQEGIKNMVAVKGTALTEEQALLLSRFAKKIILCFDQDEAGEKAMIRSLPVLEKRGLSTNVIILSEKDPDEAIKNDPIAFKKAVKNNINVYDFLIAKYSKTFDKREAEGKKKITDLLLPLLAQIENEIVKEHFVKELSSELDVSTESLTRQLEKMKEKKKDTPSYLKPKNVREREEVLEEYYLALVIQSDGPKEVLEQTAKPISGFNLSTPSYQKILEELVSFFSKNEKFETENFLKVLPKPLVPAFDTCYLLPIPKFENTNLLQEEALKVTRELKVLYLRKKIKEIEDSIKDLEKKGKKDGAEKLNKEFTRYISLLQEK